MTSVVQQSLFEAGGGTPMVGSAHWIERVMLGEIALGVCVIAVALVGALMLTGRLPLREGGRVILGCFVLLGAPVIAAGFVKGESGMPVTFAFQTGESVHPESLFLNLPPEVLDRDAGASLRDD